jgi:hypothetical protein
VQPLAAMLNYLRQQHQQQRVMPAMAAHQVHLQQLQAAHAAACAAVARANEMAVRQAMRSHAVAVQQVKDDNERKVCGASQPACEPAAGLQAMHIALHCGHVCMQPQPACLQRKKVATAYLPGCAARVE